MELKDVTSSFSFLVSALGIVTSGLTAAWSFYQKARESIRAGRQARQNEVLRLQAALKGVQDVFSRIFDYASALDHHLRVRELSFDPEEVQTRTQVDDAFEHLRDVHRSVVLDLIQKEDIGPWVYWIHRVETRDPIRTYAEACGYGAFMDELTVWASASSELKHLKANCPWL